MRSRLLLSLLLLAGTALAAEPDADADALALELGEPAPADDNGARPKDLKIFAEGSAGQVRDRVDDRSVDTQGLSLDVRFEKSLAAGWRALLSDRFDVDWQSSSPRQKSVHTLREAYVSWDPRSEGRVELGRVNAYHGVALGYNPTDFFRAGALRSVSTLDPKRLKSDRQGSVLLRGQILGETQSFSALYSPRLSGTAEQASNEMDSGATNRRHRWLLSWSRRLAPGFSPQMLVYQEQGQRPQLGLNLTALANDATVVYLEWSGGKGHTTLAQATGSPEARKYHHRLSTGLTYTSSGKRSWTAEFESNSASLDETGWRQLGESSPATYWLYRAWLHNHQELATRRAVLLHTTWQDSLLKHLDFSAMIRSNLVDHSRLLWLESRYHWDSADLALQWQATQGDAGSEYGAVRPSSAWQIAWRQYF